MTVSLTGRQEERESVKSLRRQIMALMEEMTQQRNKESAISKQLTEEQKGKAELLQASHIPLDVA